MSSPEAAAALEPLAGLLDLGYLRRWAPDLGVADLLERALAEAGAGG